MPVLFKIQETKMAIKKSPSLLRTEAKLKKLQKEIKLTEKRVKQLTA